MKSLIISGLLFFLISPIYMYFSHDVLPLKDKYPHLKLDSSGNRSIEIKAGRPSYWVKLQDVSKYGKWAIVLSEDWSFYHHQGIDPEQIKVALNEMVFGERFRGASTITQQMVKNVFLTESRSLWRKMHEIFLAQKVERVLMKDRILEIYLNSIEYGPGIYGIRNASIHYFAKTPDTLSPRESAFLALLLPSPKRYYESFKKKRLTKFAKIRIKAILKKLQMDKVITPEEFESEVNARMSWELE